MINNGSLFKIPKQSQLSSFEPSDTISSLDSEGMVGLKTGVWFMNICICIQESERVLPLSIYTCRNSRNVSHVSCGFSKRNVTTKHSLRV